MLGAFRESLKKSPAVSPESPPVLEHGHYSQLGNQLLGLALGIATFVLLFTTPDMGFTRDEGFYFRSARLYVGWFDELEENIKHDRGDASFTQENIDKHWSDNPEHPVLMKTLFGLSYRSFARDRTHVGVGLELAPTEGGGGPFQVKEVMEDSPAREAGLGEGATLTAVNGVSVDSWSQEEVKAKLRGELGAEVTLTLEDAGEAQDVTLTQRRLYDWMAPSTAMRLPTMVMTAILIWVLFLFMAEAFSRTAGFFACLAYIMMPRVFFHAHLACFDAPMTTMWLVVIFAYWKSLKSRPWAYGAGILFGVALITKLNAFFLPPMLVMHWALHGWRDFWLEKREGSVHLHVPRVPLAFATMAVIGPVIFYLFWPRHWFDTFNRIVWYIERHLGHEHYAVYYFGELLAMPPFPVEFPFVMSLVTIPLITLVAFAIGLLALLTMTDVRGRLRDAGRRLLATPAGPGLSALVAALVALLKGDARSFRERYEERRAELDELRVDGAPPPRQAPRDPRGTVLLMLIAMLLPALIIARSETPIFGGTKHWMTGMPFLAGFAGVGFAWAFDRSLNLAGAKLKVLSKASLRGAILTALTPLLLWPSVRATAHAHPYGTSYYNELIGGYIGAADAKMHRQFWGYTSRPALEWLNANARKNARVHWHNTILMAYDMYKEDGLVREDIGMAWDLESADYVLYHHQRAFNAFLYEIWQTYGTTSPVYVVSIDGVPVMSVYENPGRRRP